MSAWQSAQSAFRGLLPNPDDTSWPGPGKAPYTNQAKYGGGVTLQVVDLAYWEANGRADSTGTVTLVSDNAPPDGYWLAERLVVNTTSGYVARVDFYEGEDPIEQHRRDWALVVPGWPKIRAYHPSITVRPNRPMLIVVTALAPGDAVTLTIAYIDVRRRTA